MTSPSLRPFVSARRSARWTQALLIATAVVCLLSVLSEFFLYQLLAHALTDGIDLAQAAAADKRERIIGIAQIVLLIATAVTLLIWFRAAYKNLLPLGGRELKYSPGWAVGGFFVPFLNFVRPAQVMCEVWHGSEPSGLERDLAPTGPAIRNRLRAPVIVAAWWVLFVVSSILGNAAGRMSFEQHPTLDQLQRQTVLFMVADGLEIVSALLGVLIVVRVTRWQTERSQRLRELQGAPATAAPPRGLP